ncbi:hypothetical protein [Streptomyces sp. YIM 121038]|uniref:hypothetical protein n=1 Tax=Streptomyces sp. YIM 121038 TaxID=2136401 RepID=UPI0014862B17|nr:hypothetical protein [Streptomyces sp. YIM 121038]
MLLRRAGTPPGRVAYVARVDRPGAPALARPCPRCQHSLPTRGIYVVHFTTA